MSPQVLENIKRTVQANIDGLNTWDHNAIAKVWSDDLVFQGLPRTLGLPPMNKEQHRELFHNVLTPAFKNFKLTPLFTAYDGEDRKATVHASISANTPLGFREWELVQMMDFDESGEKITRFREFFDSKDYLAMMEAMQKQAGD